MNRSAIKDEVSESAGALPRSTLISLFRDKLRQETRAQRRIAVIRDVSPLRNIGTLSGGCEIASLDVLGRTYFAVVEYLDGVLVADQAIPHVPKPGSSAAAPHHLRLIA